MPPSAGDGEGGKTCPSRYCEPGVRLLGVMTSAGRLAYVSTPVAVDADFVERAGRDGRPEAKFRFSGPCAESACPQWTGCGCAVADAVVEEAGPVAGKLPACAIRSTCRWFYQRGAAACAVCPTVVADTGGVGTYADLLSVTDT